jgi:hypothetical protein
MPTAAEEIAAAAAKRAVKKAVQGEALKDPGFKANPLPVPATPAPGAPMGTPSNRGGRKTRRRFKKHRLMSRKYCKKTPCRRMGFTQKASCRPYKNCYTRRRQV